MVVVRSFLKASTAATVALSLGACNLVPNEGPTTGKIVKSAQNVRESAYAAHPVIFDLVTVDQHVAQVASKRVRNSFSDAFGVRGGPIRPRLGTGDEVDITIFEAGADGLFSTKEKKTLSIKAVIQPNGSVAVPYVGPVRLAGLTLEQARQRVARRIAGRAVEPDVILTLSDNASRTVLVAGTVTSSGVVPLGVRPTRVLEVLARAGGTSAPPYETTVVLTRNGTVRRASLQTLYDRPSENVFVRPGDQLFVTQSRRTISVLGASGSKTQLTIGKRNLKLVEALAEIGGVNDSRSNPKGAFVFRYESRAVICKLLGLQRFEELLALGMTPDRHGLYPIVYRMDFSEPGSYFVAQQFLMEDGDVFYIARHKTADIAKFVSILGTAVAGVRLATTPVTALSN